MTQSYSEIGHSALSDAYWSSIEGITAFLRFPRQVMESLSADRKPTLDLLSNSFTLLLAHCDGDHTLSSLSDEHTAGDMKTK